MNQRFKGLKERLKGTPVTTWVKDFKAHTDSPRDSLELWADYLDTRRDWAWIQSNSGPLEVSLSAKKVVLIASLSEFVYQLKLESMLAAGMRSQGYRVIALVSRRHPWAIRYFRAMGVNELLYWEGFEITEAERAEIAELSRSRLASRLSFSEVKQWEFEGVWIGPQLLSQLSRNQHKASPDLSDPVVQAELEALLPRILTSVRKAKQVIQATQPSFLLVNEANGADVGPITDVAIGSGAVGISFQQPNRDDAMIFKKLTPETRRLHGNSVTAQTLETLSKRPFGAKEESELEEEFSNRYSGKWALQARNQPETEKLSVEEARKLLGLTPGKKVAVVFSHVLWDANLFYGDDLFEDYGDWFAETVKAAVKNPGVEWLIKLHPANLVKRSRDYVDSTVELAEMRILREKVGPLPAHVHIVFPETKVSTHTLFGLADFAITVRGTSGIEAPCFGVPTLTAGTGRYSDLGFTFDSKTREEYLGRLASLPNHPVMSEEQVRKAKVHAHAIFRLRPWLMKSMRSEFNFPKFGRRPLDHNLHWKVSSWDELNRNGDLAEFSAWAADSHAVDYLNQFAFLKET